MQALRFIICNDHLTCKVANKCLNVCVRMEVVEWSKRWSPSFPCCPMSFHCPWKKTLIEKKQANKQTSKWISLQIYGEICFLRDDWSQTTIWLIVLFQAGQKFCKCSFVLVLWNLEVFFEKKNMLQHF